MKTIEVLMVDDNPGDVLLVREAVASAGLPYRITVARDGIEALERLSRQDAQVPATPDLLIVDLKLPRRSGRELLADLKPDPALRALPVVILSSSQTELEHARPDMPSTQLALTKPSTFSGYRDLVQAIEAFRQVCTGAAAASPITTTRVLLVEDNRAEAALMQSLLTGRNSAFEVVWVDRLAVALTALSTPSFGAVLLDLNLPDSRGLPTLERVVNAAPTLPVIVVTGLEDEQLAQSAIRHGAQDYLVKDGLSGFAVSRSVRYAMDRKQIEHVLRDNEARFKLLADTSSRLLAAEDPQRIVEELCREVMAHLDCQVFFNFMVVDSPGREGPSPRLRLNACAGIPAEEMTGIEWLDYGVAVCGCVARDGERIIVEDILHRTDARADLVRRFGVQAYCCHPLRVGGRTRGTLSFGTRTRTRFSNDDIAVMKTVTDQVAVAMQRLEAQRAIEVAKEEWERTFNSVPDLIAILDGEHRIRRLNRAMAERLQATPEQCLGHCCFEMIHGLTCPPGNCPHRMTLDDGRQHITEIHEGRLGGDFLVSTTPLYAIDGHLSGSVHVARDITDLKRAQAREQEALAAAAAARTAIDTLQAMGEGVLLADRTGRILSTNPALETLTGHAASETAGQRLDHWFPRVVTPDDLPRATHSVQRALAGEPVMPERLTLVHRDGRRTAVIPAVSFIRAPDGALTTLVLTLRDVSPLMAAQEQVAASERRYRELVQNANSIIMRMTPQYAITFFNEYAQSFFGYTEQEVLGRNVVGTIIPRVDSEGRDLSGLVSAIAAHPEEYAQNENENMTRDGRRVWVHWANRAIRDADGHVVEILCVGTDVTERRRMELENRRYQERLRRLAERLAANEEQERWQISRYIHDTVIQNLSLASIRLGTAQGALVGGPAAAADLQTTRQILDDAIAECRTVMSDLTPALLYDLGLVPALGDLAATLQQRYKVRIDVTEEGQDHILDPALRGLLFQSTRELMMNALKHAGGTAIRVTVIHRPDEIDIGVGDNGRGFDPEKLNSHENTRGGFGLFSVRQRVEGLGGRLDVVSSPGQGTTARIVAPVTVTGADNGQAGA